MIFYPVHDLKKLEIPTRKTNCNFTKRKKRKFILGKSDNVVISLLKTQKGKMFFFKNISKYVYCFVMNQG